MKKNLSAIAAGTAATLLLTGAAYQLGHESGYSAGYNAAAIYTIDYLEAYADEDAGEIMVTISYPDGTGLERWGIPVEE